MKPFSLTPTIAFTLVVALLAGGCGSSSSATPAISTSEGVTPSYISTTSISGSETSAANTVTESQTTTTALAGAAATQVDIAVFGKTFINDASTESGSGYVFPQPMHTADLMAEGGGDPAFPVGSLDGYMQTSATPFADDSPIGRAAIAVGGGTLKLGYHITLHNDENAIVCTIVAAAAIVGLNQPTKSLRDVIEKELFTEGVGGETWPEMPVGSRTSFWTETNAELGLTHAAASVASDGAVITFTKTRCLPNLDGAPTTAGITKSVLFLMAGATMDQLAIRYRTQ